MNDALQAIRLVRSHAAEWELDPTKIGIMGLSAGAELATPAALFYDEFARDNADPADPLAKVLKAGDTFYEPAGCLHRVSKNAGKGKAQVLGWVVHPRHAKDLVIPEKK